jgi:hypothetical protein
MNEHHLTLSIVPSGHPGESPPVRPGDDPTEDPFRRAEAEAEAELLRARLRHGESHAGNLGAGHSEAVDTVA